MSQPTSERGVTCLTPEAYERLSSELTELKTEGRERVSQAIGTARAHGDIRENGDYDAAQNEQGMMEARIRQLEQLLSSAVVGEVAGTSGVAGPGTVVVVDIAGEEETYFLGSREAANGRSDRDTRLCVPGPGGRGPQGRRRFQLGHPARPRAAGEAPPSRAPQLT